MLSFEVNNAGSINMTWRSPLVRPKGGALRPNVPNGCKTTGQRTRTVIEDQAAAITTQPLSCNPADMSGLVASVDNLQRNSVNVVVRIERPDQPTVHAIIDAGKPTFTIPAPGEDARSLLSYLRLGVEHLLTGWDHILFVLGLLVVFGWGRKLLIAVTAFTIGHSVTLGLSFLGVLSAPQAIVEILIALTIVALALEILDDSEGPVFRRPWLLPMSLGLLHGMGFASALSEVGIPDDEVPRALFGFNVGIELGQIAVIVCALCLAWVLRRLLPSRLFEHRALVAYGIGGLAAYWVLERCLIAFGNLSL